ncbi:MAG TPA: superoxide dismutase [Myxococcota bacterium]|nr:superoxide dismutase [Myxococcota bacterium]
MDFVLQPLPYEKNALEPHVSGLTVDVHYERHHRGYLEKLKELISGTRDAERSLDELVLHSEGEVYHNAAQVWNHDFYWRSLTPVTRSEPPEALVDAIEQTFRSVGALRWQLAAAANALFGSGYAWLVVDREDRLRVLPLPDADNPVREGVTPLLTIDVWEHAYYLDRRNRRQEYVAGVVDQLLNWEFAAGNFEARVRGSGRSRGAGAASRA